MVTAVRAHPDEPIVSTGSLPSASRDHWWERWLKVGTDGAATTESPAADHDASASKLAPSARRHHPRLTGPILRSRLGQVQWLRCRLCRTGADCYRLVTAPSAKQAGEVALVAGERQLGIENARGGDRRPDLICRLVANLDHRRGRRLGRDRDRDHPDVLAVGAGDLHQGLVVLMRHHLELAVRQALPTLGALE